MDVCMLMRKGNHADYAKLLYQFGLSCLYCLLGVIYSILNVSVLECNKKRGAVPLLHKNIKQSLFKSTRQRPRVHKHRAVIPSHTVSYIDCQGHDSAALYVLSVTESLTWS